jgi:tetrapyrrole methylase family protein / MazG family protein
MVSQKKEKASILEGIPRDLPSLSYAYRLTRRASRLGFDWPDLSGVLNKMEEELREFREALSLRNRRHMAEELGDLLFVLVNVARVLGIDPERALKGTIKKFSSRFRFIETSLRQAGKSFHQSDLAEMDRLWEKAKRRKKSGKNKSRKLKAKP